MNNYIQLATRTEAPVTEELKERATKQLRAIHGLMGLATEVGEFTDTLKRNIFYGKPMGEKEMVNIKEELGDLFWYMALLCDHFGFTFEDIQEANIAKLKARFPNAFNEHDALNRDTNKELESFCSTFDEAFQEAHKVNLEEVLVVGEPEAGLTAKEKATKGIQTARPGDTIKPLRVVNHSDMADLWERAYGIIANAYGGNWDLAGSDWKKAVQEFAEDYGKFRRLEKVLGYE